jgi:uncharacterized protein YjbI with pentapeptide repeats
MATPLLFLSHAGEDADAAKELAAQLRHAGLRVWLDVEELKPGDRWMPAIEQVLAEADAFAVYIAKSGLRNWVDQEVRVALDRATKSQAFRLIPLLGPGADPQALPLFLKQYHWLDLRNGASPSELQKLVGSVLDQPAKRVSLLQPGERPYRGLKAFDIEHARLFFGRDAEVEHLLEQMRVDRFLAVIAASGSGKSSLVRAGVIPALHRGRFHDGTSWIQSWRVGICRPGNDPFLNLEAALIHLSGTTTRLRDCADALREDTQGIIRCITLLVPRGIHTVLVIDQFEELFTQTKDAGVRQRFVKSLLEAANIVGEWPIHVIITLRADFHARCWDHLPLPSRIAKNLVAVEPPSDTALRDVIEKPLALAAATFEPGLVDRILQGVGTKPGNLPLLEFALDLLWDKAESRTGTEAERVLTHRAYDEIRGVPGAIATHADAITRRLMKEQGVAEDDIRRLFSRLVHLSAAEEGGEPTRRRLPLVELTDEKDRRLVDALTDARLLVTTRKPHASGTDGKGILADVAESASGSPLPTEIVEVAHEALIRNWDRLRDWMTKDRDFMVWRQRMELLVAEWTQSRDPDVLLRGKTLVDAEQKLAEKQGAVSPAVRDFIQQSIAHRRAEQAWQQRTQSKTAFGIFLTLLGGCLYAWFTIWWTTDPLLLNNAAVASLPLIPVQTRVAPFYWVAPALLVTLYLYLHLHLYSLWEQLARFVALVPDRQQLLDGLGSRWILVDLLRSYRPDLSLDRPPLSRVRLAFVLLLGWWLVPPTLLLFWLRYLPRHHWPGTLLHIALLLLAVLSALTFHQLLKHTLHPSTVSALTGYRRHVTNLVMSGVPLLLLTLWISDGAINGVGLLEAVENTNVGSPLLHRFREESHVTIPALLSYVGGRAFADFEKQQIEEAQLQEADLRYLSGRQVILQGAKLFRARLQGARLEDAQLRGADLGGAQLQGAHLVNADLRGAKLEGAFLEGAWLNLAQLQEAVLRDAQLQGAHLEGAQLQGAHLGGAQLEGAHLVFAQLQGAKLEFAQLQGAKLEFAQLQGANVREAWLQGAKLEGAKLEGAQLRGAIGLTQAQLNNACVTASTTLPQGLKQPKPCPDSDTKR